MPHSPMLPESHRTTHIPWLRAAVLGANDGIVSTASLILGVSAADASFETMMLTGTAGLVAGAMSMAAGEYVSVSSQSDTERADLARERAELASNIDFERAELAQIYVGRGLDPTLAAEVAKQLMAHDALGAHARDELGITDLASARPIQAALTSAVSFALGAALPLALLAMASADLRLWFVGVGSLGCLIGLGICAAKIGGAPLWKGAVRVAFWGVLAMALTTAIGTLFGAKV